MPDGPPKTRISVVATPESTASPITWFVETFRSVGPLVAPEDRSAAGTQPFDVEVVGEAAGPVQCGFGLAVRADRSVEDVADTDVVIVPSLLFGDGEWTPGRYPKIVRWLREMYDGGATICSACTGANLTAEAGLFEGNAATLHWAAEQGFRRRHPEVDLRPHETLVVSGDGGRLVTCGAATAWHDLALYLIAQLVGPTTANSVARFLLIEWHHDGQTPFQVFDPPTNHGDAAIAAAQRRIADDFAVAAPVEEMVGWSGLAPRTFKRRFKQATGHTPIVYVQRLRVERAKRLLEASDEPIEEISWAVGYEDPASFRRLFKRLTGLTPGAYRQRFKVPVGLTSARAG